jgi:parallel beta-helix repeat protein
MLFSTMFSHFCQDFLRRNSRRKRGAFSICVEPLEVRTLLSAFTVVNLNDSGAGSLRQAIHDADANPAADVINFNVAGTVKLTTGALPAITGNVDIRGNTAPGFAGTPVVEVDFNHFGGLVFSPGSSFSALRSLALDDASGAGVTLNGDVFTIISGNYIGLGLNGTSVAGNSGNGLELHASAFNDISSNVISGNGGTGIALYASSVNHIEKNSIGTDASGTLDRGNAQNGILLTNFSIANTIGGTATGGNNPTQGVFIRPPQGNLISGNDANGVLINGNSLLNVLEGNFIGTAASGNSAVGNTLDGVAIDHADLNSLIGCTLTENPFVYYNVISGNGGNGLRITNSNNTTVQGNFLGLGANNQTPVGNLLNGVVVEGSSRQTVMGGPIPLGNVDAANGQNGIVVKDTASGFISYNTFCGLAAFQTYTNLGNHADGMLITSTGGNILIRTNVITENGNDGIEISGNARDVHVGENIIGLDTNGQSPMGNSNNGIEVDGNAHDIDIGGPKVTINVIPHNVISANGGNGVAITGSAYDVHVNFSDIGTNITGVVDLGNGGAGVLVGPGSHSNTIGSLDPSLRTLISGNGGDGVKMLGTSHNQVIDTLIGTDITGKLPLPNGGNGVSITNSSDNTIGGAAYFGIGIFGGAPNVIAFNGANGVFVASGNDNGIRGNSIYGNTLLGIDLGSGANQNQAAPVLTSVHTLPGISLVSGTLTSKPYTVYTLEFFANDTSSPSGRVFLGSAVVFTNKLGIATFLFVGLRPAGGAHFITATATDLANNTSEFSAPAS